MKVPSNVGILWVRKLAICLAFFGFLTAEETQANGLPPLITVPPVGVTVQNGGTAQMTATIGLSLTPLTVIWRLNGTNLVSPNVVNATVPLVGTTLSTLTITNCSAANAGNYSVMVENGGGTVTSGDGLLVVLGSTVSNVLSTVTILTSGTGLTQNGFQLNLLKPASSNCVVEASTNLRTWTPITTNSTTVTNFSYVDTAATNLALRYYRVRLQ